MRVTYCTCVSSSFCSLLFCAQGKDKRDDIFLFPFKHLQNPRCSLSITIQNKPHNFFLLLLYYTKGNLRSGHVSFTQNRSFCFKHPRGASILGQLRGVCVCVRQLTFLPSFLPFSFCSQANSPHHRRDIH